MVDKSLLHEYRCFWRLLKIRSWTPTSFSTQLGHRESAKAPDLHWWSFAKEHGIPERVMLSYLKGEIEGEAAVKNLPAPSLRVLGATRDC